MLSKLTSPLLHLAWSYERAWRRSTGWSLVLCYHRVVARMLGKRYPSMAMPDNPKAAALMTQGNIRTLGDGRPRP